ncbi:MAG TPA: YdeI/OmpD-associated family protein, partial [Flavisolibacter sp.]|nr:YdeI/OmpD-associated family protein [Flavisolibacter sp.]
ADRLNPGVKKSFRVKGKLDIYPIKAVAILPMGEGAFIMALNAEMRKGIKKQKGDQLSVKLELDTEELKPSSELLEILADEPLALKKFNSLTKGHQNYFSKWIESAKTDATKAKRIVYTIRFLTAGSTFSEMLRTIKKEKEQGLIDW